MVKIKNNLTNPWYLQSEKIDNKLNSLGTNSVLGVKYKVKKSLRKIVKVGVKTPLIDVNIEKEKEPQKNKLVELAEILDEAKELVDLNSADIKRLKSGAYVFFHGTAKFELNKDDSEIVTVNGVVQNCDYFCNCSKKWFTRLSSSLFKTLLDAKDYLKGQSLKTFFLGQIIERTNSSKDLLILDALYIGGSIEDINTIYKNQE